MGISAGSGKGPKSILNVTPLVDVALVLLVITMVTMPVMMRNIPVTVPQDAAVANPPMTPPVQVKAMVDGTVEIADGVNTPRIVPRTKLARVLRKQLQVDSESPKTVFVDFELGMPWDQVASVIDTISGVGKTTHGNAENSLTIAIARQTAGDGF